jgi:branched-chain amino acid transport system permease protein
MIYRETGQFKTTYAADQAIFPIPQDRWTVLAFVAFAFVGVPLLATEYWLQAVLIPFLVFALAALGLNLLTGYAGQLSLGTGAFMAVGAFATFKMTTLFPGVDLLVLFVLAGLITAAVGLVFGLPSLRIKGFYLAVATLAAQFFLLWMFNKVGWFTNYNASGAITAPPRKLLGLLASGPEAKAQVRYVISLSILCVLGLAAKNLVRGRIGRNWMAVRDMDVAAEVIGIQMPRAKLLAFAISSFYCGVAGAMVVFLWLGSAETLAFDINLSFEVLFMVIIGGLGSILGSILGAGFITLVPILLTNLPRLFGIVIATDLSKNLEKIIFGGLIIVFLIAEPLGLARLWRTVKEKLRLWPFPY